LVVSDVTGAIAFIAQNVDAAREWAQPVLNLLGDVPAWAYISIVAGGLLLLWLRTRSAEQHQVAAFRSGERR